jgi:hypothetical protein
MVIPQRGDQLFAPLVRMVFSLEVPMIITAFDPQTGNMETYDTLSDYISKTGQQLQGHRIKSERFGEALVVYAREQSAAGRLNE